MHAEAPIGIFDSGVGGLTVARAIRDLLPAEDIIYFGDTAHLPYGDRSPALIQQYAKGISSFLLERNCKAIVIACNSASANALSTVQEVAGQKAVVLDVIQPLAEHIAKEHKGRTIGVIGTKATIISKSYPKAFKSVGAKNPLKTLATPLLAPMIEEGFIHNEISAAVLKSYLDRPELGDIDILILGCTHYPLISQDVHRYYGDKNVEIMDPPQLVAERLKTDLSEAGLLAGGKTGGQHFYVSDLTDAFAKSTRLFFGETALLEEVHLWEP